MQIIDVAELQALEEETTAAPAADSSWSILC
jgi:hypothetical protein